MPRQRPDAKPRTSRHTQWVRAALRIMVKAVKDDDGVGQTFNISVCNALGLTIGAVMLEFD